MRCCGKGIQAASNCSDPPAHEVEDDGALGVVVAVLGGALEARGLDEVGAAVAVAVDAGEVAAGEVAAGDIEVIGSDDPVAEAVGRAVVNEPAVGRVCVHAPASSVSAAHTAYARVCRAPRWRRGARPAVVMVASVTVEGGTVSQPWWRTSVVYQVYPRSFADSNGDGVGDLPGLIGRLDHIQTLGADVVWVSPFYPSPQADNGYDISDYQDVDPLFGTLADVDRLIAELHSRGMKLVIDIVVNHTSDAHPWFVESRRSRESPKRDWDWWGPPRDGHAIGEAGAEPTGWQSFFGGPVWELSLIHI